MKLNLLVSVVMFLTCRNIYSQDFKCIDEALQSDTIIVWMHDKMQFQPVKRKIEITRFYKNWYSVYYEDSDGHVTKRRIHRHRIKKYLKRQKKVQAREFTPTGAYLECGVTNQHCTLIQMAPMTRKKTYIRYMHILKIWPREKEKK